MEFYIKGFVFGVYNSWGYCGARGWQRLGGKGRGSFMIGPFLFGKWDR